MDTRFPLSQEIDGLRDARLVKWQLRRFQSDDLAPLMAYRNDPAVARVDRWVQIAITVEGRLIGDCALKLADEGRQAEIGFTLATSAQGRGLATEAVGLLISHAFNHWHLHRITATTDCLNHASAALLERLGFRREGHYLKNIWFKGAWGDEYLYAVLKSEWKT